MRRKSFRASIQSHTADALKKLSLKTTETVDVIVNVISALAIYSEEGHDLRPQVYLCKSITELIKRAGIGEHIVLGACTLDDTAAATILKRCAALAIPPWHVFVECGGEECQYGVFAGSTDPSVVRFDETAFDSADQSFPVVVIRQIGRNKVLLKTTLPAVIAFDFSADPEDDEVGEVNEIDALSNLIASDTERAEEFAPVVKRVLEDALHAAHGTLIAVVPANQDVPPSLDDRVALETPLSLFDRWAEHQSADRSAATASALQTASQVVAGMIGSDGITIFTTDGKLLGFRAFIPSGAQDGRPTGGARTRAFAALKQLVGSGLQGAYFQSSDGRADFEGINNG